MRVEQIYNILNTITEQNIGESAVVNTDLSNIVEVGNTIVNAMGYDNYVRAVSDVIGRTVYVNRLYRGRAPSVLVDGWVYGSILRKLSVDLMDAEENESWELNNGASYDQNLFYQPSVNETVWNRRVTFEIPISITEEQVRSSFQSPEQINAFYSMIQTVLENSMTIKNDSLIMATICSMIGDTVHDDYGSNSLSESSGIKAVNLLYLFNQQSGTTPITATEAMVNADFMRFASKVMMDYSDRIKSMSTLFNIQGKARFTPADRMHFVMLSEFLNAARVYLYGGANEFRASEYARLPEAETVPYWQGSGTDYAFSSTSKIDVKTASGNTVTMTGVVGVMFDRDTLGVANFNPRTTTHYNAKGEFWNEFHKVDAGYWQATDENMVVFFVA